MTTSHGSNVIPLFGEPPPEPIHYSDALSFMQRLKPRGSGIDHWVVAATGDYVRDCEAGRELAFELYRFVCANHTNGNVTLLQCIVGDMMRHAQGEGRERFNGVELGFLDTFGKIAFAAAKQHA